MPHLLDAISPLDGRYNDKVATLSHYVSERALIRYRVFIEIEWFIFLSECKEIIEIPSISLKTKNTLRQITANFSMKNAEAIKEIEKITHHDVKAVEYFLQEEFKKIDELSSSLAFIHFGCTSEDINNIAYALMLKDCSEAILSPILNTLLEKIIQHAHDYAEIAMLSRTHGQPATPTTLGKEFANFAARLKRQINQWNKIELTAKFNGATGNFNAHLSAYPYVDWRALAQQFIEKFKLTYNSHTTQIEPHDSIAEYAQSLSRINTILIDFSRDMWGYIALNYFKQSKLKGQIGSSTMPHKINPIDFENAEGNLGLTNALLHFFAEKLPISRWQRDLSDSTVLRNMGVALAHALLAYTSLQNGLEKLSINIEKIDEELNTHWEVLTEAIQTVLRKYKISNAYEQLKQLSQGNAITESELKNFINTLSLPEEEKQKLLKLTPKTYIGLAPVLAATS